VSLRARRESPLPQKRIGAKVAQFGSKLAFRTIGMKPSILIVDDEPQMREVLSLYLTEHGYQVFAAGTSKEALQLVEQKRINLVVLDIGLAHEDGLKLLSDIKALHPETQVVMLTGMGFVEDLLEEAHEKGADGYVSKGLPMDELLLEIKRVSRALAASGK
jgi:DNA-binding response OmpR family regulator